jgi:hypothetical protein
MAESGAAPLSGERHDRQEGQVPPVSGSDPASAVDLGALDDVGEDDFDSTEDAVFHARLYLEGLRWVARSVAHAIEPAKVYSRLEDGRCDRPPRV